MSAESWLLACRNCGYEWDAEGDGPPKPGTRCPECLRPRPVAYRPKDRGKSPKAREARAAARRPRAESEAIMDDVLGSMRPTSATLDRLEDRGDS